MRVAVHGASGVTGGFVVAEAVRRGLSPVLVGRNVERLGKAASDVGLGDAEIRVATLDDPSALADAFRDCDAVVNCAGPFTSWGEPVVRAAIEAGTHYVDTSGEQRYIKQILDTFGGAAERAEVTVVPGMADDGGAGDLIAHLTARRLTSVAELVVADLRRPGPASRGTARSMAAVFAQGPLEYLDGTWQPAEGGDWSITVPGEPEDVAVTPFALPGSVTVPAHVRARHVRSVLRSEVAARLVTLTPDVVESIPETPDEQARSATRWFMLADAMDENGSRATGWVTGPDGYRLTGVIAVEAACRLATDGAPAGALAPAQAFDPTDFLNHLTPHGVTWQVTGPRDSSTAKA